MIGADAQRWVARAVGPGATLLEVSALVGATSSAVYGVEAAGRHGPISLVLRLFTDRAWLEEEPDLARHEAWGLTSAAQAGAVVPELVAFDETGDEAGCPAVLMTRLPGSVELLPQGRRESERWLRGMAEALVPVHRLDVADAPWEYRPYADLSQLASPSWSSVPELWEQAVGIVRDTPPPGRACFIHRDYHPNNVLWLDRKVSGIVDWPNCCRGNAGIDVAWNRQNLAQLHGVATADEFLTAYEAADPGFMYHPYWDLSAAIEFLAAPPEVYPGWPAHGVLHLTIPLVRGRIDAYLASIFARR